MKHPNLREEKKLWKKGFKKVACLDEAGRGPLAGPVIAAAVVIKPAELKIQISRSAPCNYSVIKKNLKFKILLREVKDSKKLTAKKREELYKILIKNPAIEWGIGVVSEKMIDKINIKNAAELAMEKAVYNLEKKSGHSVDFLIIDGKYFKNPKLKTINYKLIVKADQKVFSCSAASIIAKVTRDRMMERYHKKYPKYGFKKHKGYPTKFHFRMLKKYGPCKIHRKTFWPVFKYRNIAR
jgi:ribonuclease HII